MAVRPQLFFFCLSRARQQGFLHRMPWNFLGRCSSWSKCMHHMECPENFRGMHSSWRKRIPHTECQWLSAEDLRLERSKHRTEIRGQSTAGSVTKSYLTVKSPRKLSAHRQPFFFFSSLFVFYFYLFCPVFVLFLSFFVLFFGIFYLIFLFTFALLCIV